MAFSINNLPQNVSATAGGPAIKPYSGVTVTSGANDTYSVRLESDLGNPVDGTFTSSQGSGAIVNASFTSLSDLDAFFSNTTFTLPANPPDDTVVLNLSITDGTQDISDDDNAITLNVQRPAPPPQFSISGITSPQSVADGATIHPLSGITLTNGSATDSYSYTVTIDSGNINDGSLVGSGNVPVPEMGGTGDIGATALESDLSNINYVANASPANTQDRIDLTITDNTTGQTVSDPDAVTINLPPPPFSIGGITSPQSVVAGATISPFSSVSLTNGSSTDTFDAEVRLNAAPNFAGGLETSSNTPGDDPIDTTVVGAAAVTAFLDSVRYVASATPATSSDELNLFVEDATTGQVFQETDAVTINRLAPPPLTLSGTTPNQTAVDGGAAINPFKGVTINGAQASTDTFLITASASNAADGSFTSTLGDGGSFSGSITGLSSVMSFLNSVTYAASATAPDSSTVVKLQITDTSTGQTVTANPETTIKLSPAPPITPAQLKLIGGDVIKFYADELLNRSTTADVTKLATDLKGITLTPVNLGQLISQALSGFGANGATLGVDIGSTFYPKISADLASNSSALRSDVTSLVKTTVAAGIEYGGLLLRHDSPAVALATTIHDLKLG